MVNSGLAMAWPAGPSPTMLSKVKKFSDATVNILLLKAEKS